MAHPALGLPPSDATAGHPELARRILASRPRLPALALEAALRIDPGLRDRHDELALRRILRDFEGHVDQLARALATGEERYVVMYGEWLVPVYRRRHVPMNDVVTFLDGLRDAVLGIVPAADAGLVREVVGAWTERLRHHRRLPGDHEGNRLVRFIWKGGGLGDDTVV
jgi:hypothetical protein